MLGKGDCWAVGRFKTFLMLANVSRMICVPPTPSSLLAIHRFHPIEYVLGEADMLAPPPHLVHLGQTHNILATNKKKVGFFRCIQQF